MVTRTTARTGTCNEVLTCEKYFEYGVAESRAKAQNVRDVDVHPAALAVITKSAKSPPELVCLDSCKREIPQDQGET